MADPLADAPSNARAAVDVEYHYWLLHAQYNDRYVLQGHDSSVVSLKHGLGASDITEASEIARLRYIAARPYEDKISSVLVNSRSLKPHSNNKANFWVTYVTHLDTYARSIELFHIHTYDMEPSLATVDELTAALNKLHPGTEVVLLNFAVVQSQSKD